MVSRTDMLRSILPALVLASVTACAPRAGARSVESCTPLVGESHARTVAAARDSVGAILAGEAIAGAAIAVSVGGQLVWSEGMGWADVQASRAVCRNTMFRLGSVSKVVTGAALLRMRDAGMVNLDADVRALLPAVSDKSNAITLRQLAGHLGGIRHYGADEYFNTRRFSTVAEGLEVFVRDSLIAEPGTQYRYSSYGYNLLGAAMAAKAGVPYLDLVRQTVLQPLGLQNVHAESQVEGSLRLATSYSGSADSLRPSSGFDTSDRWPSGGWVGSAEDVARLGAALLDPDFLSSESLALLRTSQRTVAGEETGASIGVRVEHDDSGRLLLHHGGTSIGARAFLLIVPESHVVVALVANGNATFDQRHLAGIARLFER